MFTDQIWLQQKRSLDVNVNCAKCRSPIDLHPGVALHFPMQSPRLCDDCAVLFDHVSEVDLTTSEPARQ